MKKEQGVTLIALVITIIVLVIIATVSINLVLGNQGILGQAESASIENDKAMILERLRIKVIDLELEKYIQGKDEDKIIALQNAGYLTSHNQVVVDKLVGSKLNTGNGLDNTDIYKLEKNIDTKVYSLIYYNIQGEAEDLGKIFELEKTAEENYFDFDEVTGGIAAKNINNYYKNDNKGPYEFPIENIVIPSKMSGKDVTKIGIQYNIGSSHTLGFFKMNNIKSITMPDTITAIESDGDFNQGMFSSCENLEKVVLSKNLTKIGKYTFAYCLKLKEITIPSSTIIMGAYVFAEWTSSQTINVPFKEGEIPVGWNTSWNSSCNAVINYVK